MTATVTKDDVLSAARKRWPRFRDMRIVFDRGEASVWMRPAWGELWAMTVDAPTLAELLAKIEGTNEP